LPIARLVGENCDPRHQAEGLEEWLIYLHQKNGFGWTTVSGKVKQAIAGVRKFGRKEKLITADFDSFRSGGESDQALGLAHAELRI